MSGLSDDQPSIIVTNMGCEVHCAHGYYYTSAEHPDGIEDGTLSESIPYFGSGYVGAPEWSDSAFGGGGQGLNTFEEAGCWFALWILTNDNATEQICVDNGSAPVGPISVALRCCPGVSEYGVSYLWRHSPALSNYTRTVVGANDEELPVTTKNSKKLCVVDGIIKGDIILDLTWWTSGALSPRPDCQMCLTFGRS